MSEEFKILATPIMGVLSVNGFQLLSNKLNNYLDPVVFHAVFCRTNLTSFLVTFLFQFYLDELYAQLFFLSHFLSINKYPMVPKGYV